MARRPPKAPPPIRDDEVPWLERAMAYIEAHFAEAPGLPEIAAAAGVSMFHLHRRFKLHFGETPKDVVTRLQIEEAKRLLLKRVPAAEVASRCGFVHISHFISRFKGKTGATPMRWLALQAPRGGRD